MWPCPFVLVKVLDIVCGLIINTIYLLALFKWLWCMIKWPFTSQPVSDTELFVALCSWLIISPVILAVIIKTCRDWYIEYEERRETEKERKTRQERIDSQVPWDPCAYPDTIRESLDILDMPRVLIDLICQYAHDPSGLLSGKQLLFSLKIELEYTPIDLVYEEQKNRWIVLCEDNRIHISNQDSISMLEAKLPCKENISQLWASRRDKEGMLELLVRDGFGQSDVIVFGLSEAKRRQGFTEVARFAIKSVEAKLIAIQQRNQAVLNVEHDSSSSLHLLMDGIHVGPLVESSRLEPDDVLRVVLGVSPTRTSVGLISYDDPHLYLWSDKPFEEEEDRNKEYSS